ncbi:PREDICTED: AP-3 complex subunit delta-1 [Habropoda laboriosa]|uniref:AP-3 complex subunit delta-1 n=1 Tax=Habropoda laboriosa TaxID=597456 RepID=UPI00083E22C5|nr:PREDICTED: AP-3 complex subunit delta-1 [Habropoda laboriosa]
MALRKVKGNFERMFDKNLTDLVRGIRNNKENEAKYIAQCIEEIKQELRQDNVAVKANAIAKLTYLQMLGYNISWAGFNIIEVMSSAKFTYKRIGYLAASQSFHADTELLMLTTNMIRKDLNSQNQYDAGLALSGLSCFISSDLARDLVNDIMTLLTSTKPYLRKKAVLMMYKVFLRFPEALRPAFPRLKEKLEDPDSGVQSAAVNVVCELARKNPKNYLSLAPVFFKLMTTSTNNWMLIKIIKLFGALTPLEPRLGKKLIEPLTNLIHSTSAMSLLYECINTVIAVLISISSGMPNHSDSIHLCVQKLRILIEDSDQNLKYLGLLAMSKILKTHPKSVQAHKDLIMQCLDDKDESIRLRALDLLYGMVSKKNLMEIVKKLMVHMDKAEGTAYRDELLSKIIQICSQNNYQFVTYFEWYISVLVELTRMEGTKHGPLVATQLLDVAIRVQAIRKYAVQQCALLLENSYLLTGQPRATMSEVLYAAAWICGEFSSELEDPIATLQSMLRSQASSLPGHIQAVYVHNILKLATATLCKAEKDGDTETMEQVPVPEDLDLDSWINDPPSESSDSEDLDMNDIFIKTEKTNDSYSKREFNEPSAEELQKRREARKLEQQNNPHYLKGTFKNSTSYHNSSSIYEEFENIPVAELDIPMSLKITNNHKRYKIHSKKKKNSKKSKKPVSEDEQDDIYPVQVVNTGIGELPPGAELSDSDDYDQVDINDPHRALNIDLDLPLRDDERLPVLEHRGHKKSKKKVKEIKKKRHDNQLEFTDIMWLVNSSEKIESSVADEYNEVFSEKELERKDVKHKKSKNEDKYKKINEDSKHRKLKKPKSKKESSKKSSDYEETAGISTPSKEILPYSENSISLVQPLTSYEGLAKNKMLSMMYELKHVPHQSNKLIASILITNNSQFLIQDLMFDVPDTSSHRLMRNTEDKLGVKLPFELPPKTSKETQFTIIISNVTFAQKLRGTLTYTVGTKTAGFYDKLEFTMYLACSKFMVGHLPHKHILTELLISGHLVYKVKKEIVLSQDFDATLNLICYKCNLTLVERINDTASLYGRNLKGHHVYLLLKCNKASSNLVIEGKGNNNTLLSGIAEEILRILT